MNNNHELEVFFDGACPLCRKEINLLMRRDRAGRILFTDLAGPGFCEKSAGKTYAELMARIHGRRSDGSWLEGIDLFSALYDLCHIPFLSSVMNNRFLNPIFRASYALFARYRLTLTGRKACGEACGIQNRISGTALSETRG